MSDMPPSFGRQGRRFRREAARQWVKEQMAPRQRRYGTEILWAAASTLVPLGWGEIMSGDQAPWRILLGWVLWLVPSSLAVRIFWLWSSDTGRMLRQRSLFVLVAFLCFLAAGSYSVRHAFRPAFMFTWPGLTMSDGRVIYYFVAERRKLFNLTVLVNDANSAANNLTFKIPELDTSRGGILPERFALTPSNIGHEHLRIITQARDIDPMVEDLYVSSRGYALLPAYKVEVSSYGKVLFQCESKDFPGNAQLRDCENNVFKH